MPLRTAAIRRCGFKLPRNEKYQCQKAGDKFHPIVKLWYCTRHDSHAQDRCQVLLKWAGKGAQCEQLGVLDKKGGKKLCKRHLSQATGNDWPETETQQCHSFRQGSIDHEDVWQDAARMDDTVPDEPTPLSTSHPDEPADAHHQQPLTDVESQRPLISAETVMGMEMSEQERPAEEHLSNARTSLSDSDSDAIHEEECISSAVMDPAPTTATDDITPIAPQALDMDYWLSETATGNLDLDSIPEVGSCSNPTAPTADGDHASTSLPVSDVSQSAEHSHCTAAPSVKAMQETRSKGHVETPRNLGRAPHVRMDSLSPLRPVFLAEEPVVDTPLTATSNAALDSRRSSQSFETAHGTTPARQSIQARITFLNALHGQDASASKRIVAVYAQCCVCLEKHGEHYMREVAACQHRYREICLEKATKADTLRRFNCSSCKTWTAAQKEDMTDSGR